MDRRLVLAVVLMMAVLLIPSLLFKPAARPPVPSRAAAADSGPVTATVSAAPPPAPQPAAAPSPSTQAPSAVHEDTIVVSSPLYRYGFSSRGGRLVEATLLQYPSMRPGEQGRPAQIMSSNSELLSLGLLIGQDTVWLRDWRFTPSAPALSVGATTPLSFTARQGAYAVTLSYRFRPDSYLIDASASVEGVGPNGGVLLVGMGPGLRDTEADSIEHHRESALVVKNGKANRTRFSSLAASGKPRVARPTTLSGPFEWVAVKSKYFVTALLALDTTGTEHSGGIGGVTAMPMDTLRTPSGVAVTAGLQLPAIGTLRYQVYAGPLEYPRLRAIGHDFDDVNPYGLPGIRTIIRPVALGARALLVWFHDRLGLAYGIGLILFGIAIRVVLWPLNQKAMRSTMAMQVIQPQVKELQEKHKGDPQRLQQEMFKLYKEHNVNPLGGCWPMLLPIPILFALFFVFQNTIELRGAHFLWLPDLSRPDPLYVIPGLMGASMLALSWIGQRGMPPNPQTKMMTYAMPVVMTVLFARFASGLNLYYTVMNLASLPQQAMLARERRRKNLAGVMPVPAKKRPS